MNHTARLLRKASTTNAFGSRLPDVIATGGWEAAWATGCTPWDARAAAPILFLRLLKQFRPPGRVLVPGCGSGFDAAAFSQAGFDTLGVDLSETAISRAKTLAGEISGLSNNLKFEVNDIFTMKGDFDLAFDYTLLSALPPALWPKWASAMRGLVKKPGKLVVLLFPIGNFEGGPPYAVNPSEVNTLLEHSGFSCDELSAVPNSESHPARAVSLQLIAFYY